MIAYRVSTARMISYQATVTAGADCREYILHLQSTFLAAYDITQPAVHRYAAKDERSATQTNKHRYNHLQGVQLTFPCAHDITLTTVQWYTAGDKFGKTIQKIHLF